ncbi:LuxR C-terminal-related transcriptional regulator [Pararhodobacter oceanensis]|uniref:LuxR C-terminal-related transcriptional regulator n=1 Tax=Pararhodobacter oceanensis TaxID=2172121 RepID=UPI003A8DE545
MKHSDDYFRLLAFDEAPTGLVLTENRIIRICNRRFAELLGYHVEDLLNQSFRIFYGSDEEFESIRDVGLSKLQETGGYTDERLIRHRSGQGIWCQFRARTLNPDAPLERVVMSFAPINEAQTLRLSKRERQVLDLMNQRLTSKEIARRLGLSPRTIDDVRGRLIKRFGLRRAEDLLSQLRGASH